MAILKWYSIIMLGIAMFVEFLCMIFKTNLSDKIAHLIGLMFDIPTFIYLLLV